MNELTKSYNPDTHILITSGILFFLIALAVLFSGCATNQDSQQNANSTTVSGYVDVGAGKQIGR
jgi:uncharacterized lipoprotein YajG